MHVHAPTPVLRMFDEAKAREFYLGFLGFTVEFEHRFGPGMPLYMAIALGDCKLHLSEHHGDASPGATVRIGVDELEDYHRRLGDKGYKYARPGLIDTEYGTREMTIADGFGNKLVFYRDLD